MTAADLPKIESMAKFAARLGVARSTITRAAQAGRLVMHETGKVLVEPSLKRWHETKGGRDDMEAMHAKNRGSDIPEAGDGQKNAQQGQENASTGNAGDRNKRNSGGNSGETDGSEGVEAGSRASYKAMILKFENDLIKLEMSLRRGHRYQLDAIRHEASSIGGTLRAGLERLIDQTAPRLALITDPAARRRLLQSESRALARIIKNEFPRAMRRMQRAAKKHD